jgi:hypothetical protein
VAGLWRWPDRFAIGGFVCALGFLATVNLLDPDADVAAHNLARRDELSTRLVRELSDDAVPTLAAALPTAGADAAAPGAQPAPRRVRGRGGSGRGRRSTWRTGAPGGRWRS